MLRLAVTLVSMLALGCATCGAEAATLSLTAGDHAIKDSKGHVASAIRNFRITLVSKNVSGKAGVHYTAEWDISNVTHNVTSKGVNGPDSHIYVTIFGKTPGQKWIFIWLAGRSSCIPAGGRRTVVADFPVDLANLAGHISISDSGVVGPQAAC